MKKPNRIARKGDTARTRAQAKRRAASPVKSRRKAARIPSAPVEYAIVSLREVAPAEIHCATSFQAVDYWRLSIATAPNFNPDVESFVAVLLDTQCRIRGHHVISVGTLNETLVHPREAFRAGIIGAAYSIIFMHNHPSGYPWPSREDIAVTRLLVDGGNFLRVHVFDHIIVGRRDYCSLREVGYIVGDRDGVQFFQDPVCPTRAKKTRGARAS